MRVLIISDDQATAATVGPAFAQARLSVHLARSESGGIGLAKTHAYDLVLIDLNQSERQSHEALCELRSGKVASPIIILGTSSSPDTMVEVFKLGADAYLHKPFESEELVARCKALIRRSKGHSLGTIQIGPITVDLDAAIVQVEGSPVALTPREYRIMELLAIRSGSMVPREAILDHLYSGLDMPGSKAIDVFVCKLRRKLASRTGGDSHIDTLWGRGYMLRQPPRTEVLADPVMC